MVMLWRSLRAVLRKESCIFCCAGLVSICRSPSFGLDAAPVSLGRAISRSVFRAESYNTALDRAFQPHTLNRPNSGAGQFAFAGPASTIVSSREELLVIDVSLPTDFNTNLLMM